MDIPKNLKVPEIPEHMFHTLSNAKKIDQLDKYSSSPNENGFYEIGYYDGKVFFALYGGRAIGESTTIRSRLSKHFRGRGNPMVAMDRDNMWYRCVVTKSIEQAAAIEKYRINRYRAYPNEDKAWAQQYYWNQQYIEDYG